MKILHGVLAGSIFCLTACEEPRRPAVPQAPPSMEKSQALPVVPAPTVVGMTNHVSPTATPTPGLTPGSSLPPPINPVTPTPSETPTPAM